MVLHQALELSHSTKGANLAVGDKQARSQLDLQKQKKKRVSSLRWDDVENVVTNLSMMLNISIMRQ